MRVMLTAAHASKPEPEAAKLQLSQMPSTNVKARHSTINIRRRGIAHSLCSIRTQNHTINFRLARLLWP